MKGIVYLITILLIIVIGFPLTTVPTFAITDKYIETGTYALTTVGYFFGNNSWIGVKQTTFAFPLQRNHPSYIKNLVFQQLNFLLTPSYEYNVSILVCGNNATTIITCLSSTALNDLNTLRLRYIVLDSGFTKITFYTLFIYNSPGTILNSANPFISNFGGLTVNTTGTVRAFIAWKGFNITAPDSNLAVDLKATAYFLSATVLQLKIETTVSGDIMLGGAFFCFVGYNQAVVAAWPFPSALMNYASFASVSGSPAIYTDSTNITRDYNTFWGVTRINFNNQPSIHFTSDLTPSTSISGTSSTAFNNLDFQVLIFQFKQCDPTTPYYRKSNDTCYDICPIRQYGSNTQYTCQLCVNYDCYYCNSSGACTTCSNTTDFRVLNASTNRCDAMPGYYDDGTSNPQAQPCNSNCKTCQTSATNCTSCADGSYLNSSQKCDPCMQNCLICSSNSSCTTCAQYYNFSMASSSCESTINCSAIANCTVCNISSGCTQCVVGYNASNMTTCSPVCGDGYKLSFEGCDDNNTASGDGCSANCTIEAAYYCTLNGTTSVCGNCSIHCSACTTQSSCQSCYSPYILNNATSACVPNCSLITLCLTCHEPNGTNTTICDSCSIGYTPINNTCSPQCGDAIVISPQQCDDGNTVNGDGCSSTCTFQTNAICNIVANKSICSFCPAKKYADSNHSACLNCIYECATCDAAGCLSCGVLSHRTLNTTTHRCVPNDGYYDDTVNEVAATCSFDCLTCSAATNTSCLSCSSSRILSNGSCLLCSAAAGVGCSSCSVNGSTFTCLNCSGNLQNGTCYALPTISLPDDPSSKMLLLILLPALLALLCCCLILFLIWRRRKNEQNKVQEDDPSKMVNDLSLDPKIYKVDSKKLDVKVENNDTEGNELSVNEFKEVNDIKVQIRKDKSEMNDHFQSSNKSDFSRSVEEQDEGASKGCQY